jgi:thymidylate synthase
MYLMQDYDDAIKRIISEGVLKKNRTGVETISVCGIQSRYRIDKYFPIITGRKVWPKAVFAELLWFLSGSTNNEDLKALGANFWTPWVDEEFEKKHGYAPGCFGPVYGFQLRHFDGHYGNGIGGEAHTENTCLKMECNSGGCVWWEDGANTYGAGGHDQLADMVRLLKEDPDNRRNLFSLWNPKAQSSMRLPPCHYTFQVYSHEKAGHRYLSGHLTQRSCDFPIGVPANIQFYSALIYMLAQQTDHLPYEFIHTTVDSHIYKDQLIGIEQYLAREKPPSPRLKLKSAPSIEEYDIDCFELIDYNPQPAIEMPVAV